MVSMAALTSDVPSRPDLLKIQAVSPARIRSPFCPNPTRHNPSLFKPPVPLTNHPAHLPIADGCSSGNSFEIRGHSVAGSRTLARHISSSIRAASPITRHRQPRNRLVSGGSGVRVPPAHSSIRTSLALSNVRFAKQTLVLKVLAITNQ